MKKVICFLLCAFWFASTGAFAQYRNTIDSMYQLINFADSVTNGYPYSGRFISLHNRWDTNTINDTFSLIIGDSYNFLKEVSMAVIKPLMS